MKNLYEILQNPSKETLQLHSIEYFDKIVTKYPKDYKNIIRYINDCFNYNSELLAEDKDWGRFLMNRFEENNIPDHLLKDIIDYESEDIVFCMASFLAAQKETSFTTLVAKQNLRLSMLAIMQKSSATTPDKKNANEMVSSLDIEIAGIYEKLRQGQKVFGNFVGYEQVRSAKNSHKINIAMFID